jgi:hypothetical protein
MFAIRASLFVHQHECRILNAEYRSKVF